MFIKHYQKTYFLINDVFITFKYMSLHIEQPKGDCLYNSYKDGDVCRGKLYFIKMFSERLNVSNKCKNNDTSFTILFM